MTLHELRALLRRDVSRNALFSLGSKVVAVPLSLLTLALVTRTIPVADFGRFSVFTTVVLVATAVMGVGVGPTVVRFAAFAFGAGRRVEAYGVLRAGLGVQTVTTALVALAGLLLAGLLARGVYGDPALEAPLAVAFGAAALASGQSWFIALFRATNRFGVLAIGVLLGPALQLGAIVVLARAGRLTLLALVLVYAASLVPLIVYQATLVDWRALAAGRLDGPAAAAALEFGKWMCVIHVVENVATRLDILLLGYFVSAEDVAVYAAAYRILDVFALTGSSLSFALLPKVSFLAGRAEDLRTLPGQILDKTAFLAFPMGFGLLAVSGDLVTALFGDRYRASATVLAVLLPAGVAAFLTIGAGEILMNRGRPSQVGLLAGLNLVANVALNLLLIPRWGVFGAAVATVGSFAAVLLVAWALALARLEAPLGGALVARVLRYALAAALMWALLGLLDLGDPWLNLAAKVPAGAAAYLVLAALPAPRALRAS